MADHAKKNLRDLAKKLEADPEMPKADIVSRQLWLAKLNKLCKKPDAPAPAPQPEIATADNHLTPRELCFKWPWDSQQSCYTWQVHLDIDMPLRTKRAFTPQNFRCFLTFCNSVFELAVLAFVKGRRLELPSNCHPSGLC